MTRSEHLKWAKERAYEYLDAGDVAQAWTSFRSDMNKHPDLAGHIMLPPGDVQYFSGTLSDPVDMRDFIEGFN